MPLHAGKRHSAIIGISGIGAKAAGDAKYLSVPNIMCNVYSMPRAPPENKMTIKRPFASLSLTTHCVALVRCATLFCWAASTPSGPMTLSIVINSEVDHSSNLSAASTTFCPSWRNVSPWDLRSRSCGVHSCSPSIILADISVGYHRRSPQSVPLKFPERQAFR